MSLSPVWDALKPFSARMPTVVREHEIFRVAAIVQGADAAGSAKTTRRQILSWAARRSGGRLPDEAWDYEDFEYVSGGRNCDGVRIKNDGSDIWSIRADVPDKHVPGRTWTTEVAVGLKDDQPPRFSMRLLVSTQEDELKIEPQMPGLVQQIVEQCGLSCGKYGLATTPWLIQSEDEVERLIEMMLDPERPLPIFVLTSPDHSINSAQPLVDASELARATLGAAHVVVVPSAFTWALTERFGKRLSVFGGAVRAYLPGFTEDSSRYGSHKLVLADQLSTADDAQKWSRWMKSLASSESVRRGRLGRDILTFAEIKDESLKFTQQRLKRDGATDSQQLEAANTRISLLERQAETFLQWEADLLNEHKAAEERAETAETQASASAFRIQQLLGQFKKLGQTPDTDIGLPDAWRDFAEWCDVHLAGRVVLAPLARREVRFPEFENVALVARSLLWLANNGRDRRIEGGGGSLREEVIEEGIKNTHCGSDEFDLEWQGKRHSADWHIKNGGNTRDPKRCLRIYYFWDAVSQQIVVADLPAHRRTGAS